MQQTEAFDLLKMGKNIFLTGEAGSGKTYLLNKYIQYLKENNVKVAVTASTGIAATHLQGNTIHSWSGIGVRDSLSEEELEKIITSDRVKRNYRKTRVLVIDEISMLHKHQLEMVDTIARALLNSSQPYGGMQVIVCGDFFQLPPVAAANTLMHEKQFAFEASAWEKGDFYVCYLQEQHRQINDPLHGILNDIRSGTAGEHTKIPLRTRYKKEPHGNIKATKLYSRNVNVDLINIRELENIDSPEKIFQMTSVGYSQLVEGLKKNCLAPEELKLKIGAQVMFIKNHPLGKYVNGTRCTVIGFDRNDGWPIVKTFDNDTFIAEPEKWQYEDDGIVRATITQIPLKLAWAITIHKSQGMTLDAAEIDLGDAFEPGMGYVALSRVRRLDGLKLMNLNEIALQVHPKILAHDKIFKQCSFDNVEYLKALSNDEITQEQKQTLSIRFGGCAIKPASNKGKKEKSTPTHYVTLEMLKNELTIAQIANERDLSLGTILTHIEKLQGLQLINSDHINHLKSRFAQEEFDAIFSALKASADGKLMPVYEQFNGKYTFETIRLVRLFVL
ncbi:MAG: helix-turn-helix domain-containing protein [Legionellales bacterium]|jgi:ATP-dependent exoDNAse (exonuclease V) alpha subunit